MHLRSSLLYALPLLATAACTASSSSSTDAPPKQGPLLSGSSPASTEGVATADLFPSMSARSDENGIRVVAALLYPAGNFLTLGSGDTLTATVHGVTKSLERESESGSEVHFFAAFSPDDAATEVVVSFLRAGGEASAPDSVVPLAPAFQISGPATLRATQEVGLGALTPAKVTPALPLTTNLAFRVHGPCVPPAFADSDQPAGSDGGDDILFDVNRFLDPVATNCPLSIEVRAETKGTWDPAFHTDSQADVFEGVQARSFDTTWNPM
jgi:hypothetical protein